ncbi:hypothetical protein BGM19_33570 [Streptomyces agglomeratus]|nr:hypothetical protein BGM19_33570 [Streptomyces agglomeratus]
MDEMWQAVPAPVAAEGEGPVALVIGSSAGYGLAATIAGLARVGIRGIGVGAGALFLLEHAMQAGPLVASQPALTLGDAGVSLALGIVLYEEHVRSGWWLLPEVLGVALVAAGVLMLSRVPIARAVVAPESDAEPGATVP